MIKKIWVLSVVIIICLFQFIQAEQEVMIHESNIDEIMKVWQAYLNSIDDWQNLIKDIKPKVTACGLIYEIANPINRAHESFAIAICALFIFANRTIIP